MARYILIDRHTGYIFGDSADIDGRIVTGTPCEVARALDESIGVHWNGAAADYSETNRYVVDATYDVYRADIDGSEAVPVIVDGQDREMIKAVERHCRFVTSIRRDLVETSQ